MANRKSNEERFWAKVDKAAGHGPNGDCWLWNAAKNKKGYGTFGFDGKTYPAHRRSYVINIGPVPDELYVLHSCDNPSCVNPSHLRLGTNQQNMDDKAQKGRHWSSQKSFCKHGHAFTPENTYERPNGQGRSCISCRTAASAKHKRARKPMLAGS